MSSRNGIFTTQAPFVIEKLGHEALLLDDDDEETVFTEEVCKQNINGTNYIARGSYATIYQLGEKYCMKTCNPSQLNMLELTMELFMLSQLSHPNIIKTEYVINHKRSLTFVLPYYTDNLETLYPQTEEQKLSVMKQLTSALNYIHSKQILHLDICSRNILAKQIDDKIHVTLCDFSLSCVTTSDEIVSVCPKITTDHRPYENLRGSKRYSKKSDIWSLGIVFYKIIHDKHLIKLSSVPSENPVAFDYELSTRFEIEQLQSWGDWPCSTNEIIIKMLELDIRKRADSEMICDMLGVDKYPEKLLKRGSMTLKHNWVYVSTYFKKIDSICLKQVEMLYTVVMNELALMNIHLNEDEKNNYFLSCYAIIKSSMNMISGINIQNASALYCRVYEIFQLSKGKILSYDI